MIICTFIPAYPRDLLRYMVFFLFFAIQLFGMDTDDTVLVVTPRMKVLFHSDGSIINITSRYHQLQGNTVQETFAMPDSSPLLRIQYPSLLPYTTHTINSRDNDSIISVDFRNDVYTLSYTLYAEHYVIDAYLYPVKRELTSSTLENGIQLSAGRPVRDNIRSIAIRRNHEINLNTKRLRSGTISKVSWFGFRNRFWAFLVKSADTPEPLEITDHTLQSTPSPTSSQYPFRVYAGPVEYHSLHQTDRTCTHLLYPLWFWMRWLTIGLLQLFNLLLHLSGNTVLSIILLSIAVKIIIAPLFSIANRWQRKVNEQKSLLEPRLKEIRRQYKGEEQHQRTLEAYKEMGISPLYSLKSLLSAAIQIPVFFAAYHMLNEHIALQDIPCLWIDDCSYPDRLFSLPFSLPLLGNDFNILPFIMTGITIAASCIHTDRSLSPSLHRQQRSTLVIMATLFFLLLYTSSAGMLIYWTMNNVLAFLGTALKPLFAGKQPVSAGKVRVSS